MERRFITIFFVVVTGFSVMAQTQLNMLNPFHIEIDPMERLLLVNFEKDPDSLYVGFEPQVFNDEINGKGHLVIGWRVDGKVDVYHQPSLKPDPEKYDIAGKGLANMLEREMSRAYFEVNDFGVQASYEFADLHGRAVRIKISESNPRQRKPFGLLAPMGHAAENPSAMPLLLLHDFYLVREKHSEITININGQKHHHDKFPIRMDGTRMTFLRYSPDPLIATLNPASETKLEQIKVRPGWNRIEENMEIEVSNASGIPSIKNMRRTHQHHVLNLSFEPAFPDIGSLAANTSQEGVFIIAGHPSTGTVEGIYTVENRDFETRITLMPSEGWKPKPDRFSLRVLYRVVKMFRQWPKTYIWEATIIEDGNTHYMRSGWKRTGN